MNKIKAIFSDPEENCHLNEDANFTDTHNGKLEIHNYAWIASAIFTIAALIISFYLIYKHCRNYTNKYHQRYIVRILLMVPIYAIDSFLSFRFYGVSIYFDLVRDTYEAFVINTFFCLLIEYSGGYAAAKETFAQQERVKLIFPLNCIHVRPKRGLLRTLKRITLQYVIIRPLTAVAAVILQAMHLYCLGNWNFARGYIYITFILFVSVSMAMYALVQFYHLAADSMKQYAPIGKFLSVKFVIFMSFWQSIVIAGLVYVKVIKATTNWSTDNVSDGVQNVLITFEMLIASIAHIYVFSHKEYIKEGVKTPLFRTFAHVFNPYDIARDIKHSFYPKKKKSKRGKKAIQLDDVAPHSKGPTGPADQSTIDVRTKEGYGPQVDVNEVDDVADVDVDGADAGHV